MNDLPGHVGYNDVIIESTAVSGGALNVRATVMFAADVTVPKHARQFGDTMDAEKDNLRRIARDRFYGDVQRNAVACFHAVIRSLKDVDGVTPEIQEKISEAFTPLLKAGEEITKKPEREGGK